MNDDSLNPDRFKEMWGVSRAWLTGRVRSDLGRRSGQVWVVHSMAQVGDFCIFDCAPEIMRLFRG
jgi:hypothetical protein